MAASITLKVTVDKRQLEQLKSDIKNLKNTTINVKAKSDGVDSTKKSVDGLNSATKKATESTESLGDAFFAKVKWGLIQTSIRAVADAFLTAVDNMKEVDTQLTNIAKVTNQSVESLSGLADKAYSTASKYGIAAGQYMESVYEYTKAGFKDNADEMGELSTKAMLVGDTTASIADKFLIAGNAAWNMGGNIEKLSLMVDQADYINNNYATTLDKIAEGFPRVASVANMAGMTAEETMAALGTITATTQETASRASTALRALIINILGDTSTEIEDGITATEESIAGLRDALKQYAPEVVRAADATGQLIDPMKALEALSNAYKDGLLTERGLYQIETALGGKLRTNQLDALLKNFSMYKEMLEGMGTAAGTADKEISTMLESWESKLNILENTWTEFVSKSLDSKVFKGFIDGVTRVIGLFGNLGNMAITVGGLLVAMRLPQIVGHLQKFGGAIKNVVIAIKNFATGVATASSAISVLQAAIGVVTIAFTAYTMVHNDYLQKLSENTAKAKEAADASGDQADSVYELYGAYNDARKALEEANKAVENGNGSAEDAAQAQSAFETATRNLAEALGIEAEAIGAVDARLSQMTKTKLREAIGDAKDEILAIEAEMLAMIEDNANEVFAWNVVKGITFGLWDNTTEAQDYLYDLQAQINGAEKLSDKLAIAKEGYASISEAVKDLKKQTETEDSKEALGLYADWKNMQDELGQYILEIENYEDKIVEYRRRINLINNGNATAKSNKTTAESFDGVTESANNAGNAIERYRQLYGKAASSASEYGSQIRQTGDDWKTVGQAYAEAFEDIEAGLRSSDKIKSVAELLFSEEALWEARKRGDSYADLLSSDLVEKAFTYLDDEGKVIASKGEDFGALLINSLYGSTTDDLFNGFVADIDEAGNRVIKKGNEIAASIKLNDDGTFSYVVDDVEALADALGGWNPEILDAAFRGVGLYSEDFHATAENAKSLAESLGAITNLGFGDNLTTVDFETFVRKAHEAGMSLMEIAENADAINKADDIQFNVSFDKKSLEEQIEEVVAKAKETPVTVGEESAKDIGDRIQESSNKLREAQAEAEKYRDIIKATAEASKELSEFSLLNRDKYHDYIKGFDVQTTDIEELKKQLGDVQDLINQLNVDDSLDPKVKTQQLENAQTILEGIQARINELQREDPISTNAEEEGNQVDKFNQMVEEYNKNNPDKKYFWTNAPEATENVDKLTKAIENVPSETTVTINYKIGNRYGYANTFAYDIPNTLIPSLFASGTENAPGGLALVNDGNGPELIVEDGNARIAGEGKPTLTVLQKGATVFNAEDTRQIFQRSGIPAFGNGYEGDGVPSSWKPKSTSSKDDSKEQKLKKVSTYDGTTSKASDTTDEALEALKAGVERAKSWLEYSKAIYEYCGDINEGYERQKELTEQVAAALLEQAHYLEQTGGDQTEINNLYSEYFKMLHEADELAKKALEEKKSLLESELELLEAQERPLSERQSKEQEIVNVIDEQIALLETLGGQEEEINKLLKEKLELEQNIKNMAVEEAEEQVSLLKSQLDVLEAKDAPLRKQIAKQREIQEALKAQLRAMKAANASAEDINKVRAELYDIEQNIKNTEQELYDRVLSAAERKIDKINEKRDAELEKLEKARDAKKEQNDLEEKELALAEAKERLANARAERNVRVWNAAKGQWEWVANAQDVEAAQKEVASAQKAIDDYNAEKAYEAEVAAINEKYDKLLEPWQKVVDKLTEPVESFGHALKELGNNATEAMLDTIRALSGILRGTGYTITTPNLWLDVPVYDSGGVLRGLGGVKATKEDEMILPPELTKAMLNPKADSLFKDRLADLNLLYGAGATKGMNQKTMSNVGEQINGDVYNFGDVSLSETEAKHTTVYELAKMSRGLKSYVATAR